MLDRSFTSLAMQSHARLGLVFSAIVAFSAAAEAAGTRYVASNGNNANNCLALTPCRTLQRGVDVAPAGGEVVVLDFGSYGNSLAIAKSITISADGVTATLGNPGTITIDGAGAVVALRGLHLQGIGFDPQNLIDIGIRVFAAAAVRIERCTIERFGTGIYVVANDVEMFVADSIVRNNGAGLYSNGSELTVDNSRFEDNMQVGVGVQNTEAVISRTVAARNGESGIVLNIGSMNVISSAAMQNGGYGFYVEQPIGQMTLESSTASGNALVGLKAALGGTARISNSTFTNNGIGLENDGGIIETRQNNTVRDNGTDVVGPLTIIPGT